MRLACWLRARYSKKEETQMNAKTADERECRVLVAAVMRSL